MRSEATIAIRNVSGLHARPAAVFVQAARAYTAGIEVRNVSRGGTPVDAKSILGVLTLGVTKGQVIGLVADGDDAADAIEGLRAVIEAGLGER